MSFEITKEQAIELSKSKFWEGMTPREIAIFQLFTERICMPWSVFRDALEETLGAPMCDTYLANPGGLRNALLGVKIF